MKEFKTGDVISFTLGELDMANDTFEIKGTDLTISFFTLDRITGAEKAPAAEDEKVMCKPYRTASALLEEPDDMDEKEKEQLKRIKAIPEYVRHACALRVEALDCAISALEKEHDALSDYLNGEEVE